MLACSPDGLKKSNSGDAMGSGTEVAREAFVFVLLPGKRRVIFLRCCYGFQAFIK